MIDTDTVITILGEAKAKDGGTWLKCKAGYYVNKKYMEFIRYIQEVIPWLNVAVERKRKRVVDNEIPPRILFPGGIFYLSFFVKYIHPTTVAPNIDIVAIKGS